MQEIKKPNFVKNRKLAKTTIFTAIFIVAMLFLSSITPAVNVKEENGNNTTNTVLESLSNPIDSRYSTNTGASGGGAKPAFAIDILTEGFEGGTMPPAGWQHIQYNTVETWYIDTASSHSGSNSARCDYDSTYTDVQDEWMITPSMNFTGYDNVYLSFWWMMSYYWGVSPYDNYDCNVYVSTDSGGNWTLVWNEDSIGTFYSWTWYDATLGTHVDLTAYNIYSDVLIGFQYDGWDGAQLSIDDVYVYGVIIGADDVGVTSIDEPTPGTVHNPITPKATVTNFGSAAQTNVPVDMSITAYGTPIYYYCDGFETYTQTSYVMPAGWTVETMNPTGTWFLYHSSDTYSSSAYPRCQESGSDGGAQDENLTSPIIDCSGLTSVELFMDKYFYSYSTDYATFTIYGSNDSGSTWMQILQYTSSHTSDIFQDISSWAAGENDVCFKFRFQSPADSTLNSYVYFDNMRVYDPTYTWGTYGDNPPPGWTITRHDTTAWNNNHWHKYSSTSYDMSYNACARIYYTSPYVERNDSLISPSFSCGSLSKVYLRFNGYCYSSSTYQNIQYIEISTDGGTSWQVIDDNYYDDGAYYSRYYTYEHMNFLDITSFAAGETDVKLRFRMEDFYVNSGGYWYIDNIRVYDPTTGTYAFQEYFAGEVYYEGFKHYTEDWGDWDWIKTSMLHYYNQWWNVASGTSPTASPYEGTKMANYRSYNAYDGHKARLYLDTPINVAAANTLMMSFAMFHDTGYSADDDYIEVLASHDGVTWEIMDELHRYDGTDGWSLHIVDLTGYEDDTALQIAFEATSEYGNNMYIDDVCIFDPGFILEYTDTQLVDIPARTSVQVEFSAWAPAAYQTQENVDVLYDLFATTNLAGDQDPTNDAQTITALQLHFPYFHDIAVVSIDEPNSGIGEPKEVKVTIANIGQYRERNFFVPVQIGTASYAADFNQVEDFEGTDGTYIPNGIWEWGTPIQTSAHSGSKVWGTDLDANYVPGLFTLDTRAFTVPVGGNISFWLWYDTEASYDGCNVKISTDGGSNWNLITPVGGYSGTSNTANPLYPDACWTGHVQGYWEHVTFDLSAYGTQSVMIRFSLGADGSVHYPGMFIDDVKPKWVPSLAVEYDESAAIASWFEPGTTLQLTYPDWTPANLAIGASGPIEYIVKADAQNSPDGQTSNNILTKAVTLTYTHDVGIKEITSPTDIDRDLLFHQRPFLPTESWTHRSSSAGGGYLCQDNFWDLTAPINNIEFWGLCLIFSGGWIPGNPNTLPFEVKFYQDGGTSPGAVVQTFALPAITPVNTGLTYSGFTMYYWNYDLPSSVNLVDGWISIQSQTAPDNAWLLWTGSPEGDLNMWQQGSTTPQIAGDCAYNLSGQAGGQPGIDIYIQPGSQTISTVVENLGTFPETGLTCYAEIWEYISDPNGTLNWSANEPGITLDIGEEEPVDFGSYNFEFEGVYGLFLNLPLTIDDVQGNNMRSVGIGIDDTAPETTHTVTPATPDGLNGWYVSNVGVTLEAEDPEVNGVSSGVDVIKYKVDSGSEQTYTGEITVSTDGEHTVYYYAIDNVGNTETQKTVTFKIDKGSPNIALSYEVTGGSANAGYTVVWTATADDETSGMDKVEFYFMGYLQDTVSGPGPTYTWTINNYNPDLAATFRVIGFDMAGNTAEDSITDPDPRPNNHIVNGVTQPIVKTVKINLGR
jgi:hypothetical protein